MTYLMALYAAATEGNPVADVVSLVITSVVSATVFSALITGLVQFLINRRNSRVTERKNTVDEKSDLVAHFRGMATEEREAKESAVQLSRDLLADSQEQVSALTATVATLNTTIALMKDLNASQSDVIMRLTSDRDRTQAALDRAEARISEQREMLRLKQEEISSLRTRGE